MSDQTIRVGIVGAGANTRSRHIPGLQSIEGVRIVSVCNRHRESSQRVADEYGIERIYGHWRELVEADDTDAIVIGTWPYLHCRTTITALKSGKHVLCEARMARNAAEARTMLETAQARPQLVAQVVPAPHTLGQDATIVRLIGEGYLGDVLGLEIRALQGGFPEPESPMHWRQDTELNGFNIMGLGIWYEAIMRWIGPADAVTAMGKTVVRMRPDPETGAPRAVGVPEHLDVVARMTCGAQAHLLFSSVSGPVSQTEALLFGSEGTLKLADGQLFGARRGDEAFRPIAIPEDEAQGWRVEEEFINAIRGREPVRLTTFEKGVRYMEFVEAVTRSMQRGRTVALPL